MTSANTFSQGANDVRKRQLEFIVGQVLSTSPLTRYIDLVNSFPQQQQVTTFDVIGGTTAGDLVIVTVNGIVKTYIATSADTTTTLLAAAVAALINSDPLLKGVLTATSAIAVVTLTGMEPGDTFTVVAGTNTGSVSTPTAAATADSIPFGVGLAYVDDTSTVQQATFATKATSDVFDAQVTTLNIHYTATQQYIFQITINGVTYPFNVIANTSTSATCDDIVTAINAATTLTDLVTAVKGGGNATVVITANTAGLEFSVFATTTIDPSTDISITNTTGPDQTTSIVQAFAGACPWVQNVEQTAIGSNVSVIPPNDVFKGLETGWIGVASAETVKRGGPVYIELDDGSGLGGQFYTTASATRQLLPKSTASWQGMPVGGADGYANILNVNA